MLADMLDTPISELAMGYNVNVVKHFVDTRALHRRSVKGEMPWNFTPYLIFLQAVLKDILYD